jgi:hypothetical protein
MHNATDGKAMERAHKRIHRLVRNLVLSFGVCVIRHCNIRAREINLFRNDGTHLSKRGIDIYLNNIQGALQRIIITSGSNARRRSKSHYISVNNWQLFVKPRSLEPSWIMIKLGGGDSLKVRSINLLNSSHLIPLFSNHEI